MRPVSRVMAILAVCAAGGPAHPAPCSLALNSRLPISGDGTIQARIAGAPANFLLDTGSSTTLVTAAAAKRLRLRPDPDTSSSFRGNTDEPWLIDGLGGGRLGSEVMVEKFEVGALTGRKFHLLTADIALRHADGLLSTDFLHGYDIDLDFPAQELRLFRAYGTCGHTKVLLQPPVYATPLLQSTDDYDRRPRVAVLIGGQRLVALVDTGAYRSAIFARAAELLGIGARDEAADRTMKVHGIGPAEVAAVEHVFPAVTVGDLTVRNMRLEILADRAHGDIDMILGADFQHRMHLWISNSSQSLVMQYPPQASPPVQ